MKESTIDQLDPLADQGSQAQDGLLQTRVKGEDNKIYKKHSIHVVKKNNGKIQDGTSQLTINNIGKDLNGRNMLIFLLECPEAR